MEDIAKKEPKYEFYFSRKYNKNMKRDIYKELCQWKASKNRKPLLLKGARQVGKTYILKEFAKNEYLKGIPNNE